MSYWFNTRTRQVETDENRSQGKEVMGPYETEAEAANALQTAAERTEKWDQEDRAWDARGSSGSSEDSED